MSTTAIQKKQNTYTSTTFIIIISCIVILGIIIYLYNYYKSIVSATNITVAYTACPDYWDSIGESKCKNTNMLGVCNKTKGGDVIDFSNEIFSNNNTGNYSKCKWTKGCGLSWSNIDRLC